MPFSAKKDSNIMIKNNAKCYLINNPKGKPLIYGVLRGFYSEMGNAWAVFQPDQSIDLEQWPADDVGIGLNLIECKKSFGKIPNGMKVFTGFDEIRLNIAKEVANSVFEGKTFVKIPGKSGFAIGYTSFLLTDVFKIVKANPDHYNIVACGRTWHPLCNRAESFKLIKTS